MLNAREIGGWFPEVDSHGIPDKTKSKWFSLEITKEDFPWTYEREDTPSRVISTLEALAVLISLKMKYGEEPQRQWSGPQHINDLQVSLVRDFSWKCPRT